MSVTYYMSDCIGFVQRLDTFGNDLTIVNAARVSFNKESSEISGADAKLIKFLVKHNHISPFFHPQIRFRFKMPIFVAREWFRHTVGLSRNEVSRRYVDTLPDCWIPRTSDIRERDPKLKQGSKESAVVNADSMYEKIVNSTRQSILVYAELLHSGVAPEIARGILPQTMYTEFIETGSLYAYARICSLRLDPGAQVEIRRYAKLVDAALATVFPIAWDALRAKFNKGSSVEYNTPSVKPSEHPVIGYGGIGC